MFLPMDSDDSSNAQLLVCGQIGNSTPAGQPTDHHWLNHQAIENSQNLQENFGCASDCLVCFQGEDKQRVKSVQVLSKNQNPAGTLHILLPLDCLA